MNKNNVNEHNNKEIRGKEDSRDLRRVGLVGTKSEDTKEEKQHGGETGGTKCIW